MTRQVLEVDSCAPYLLKRGLTSASQLLDSGCKVFDVTRRNANFKVVPGQGQGFLVKQISDTTDNELVAVLRSEAATLAAIQDHAAFRKIRGCAPSLIDYDDDSLTMVTELIHPATSLTKLHLNGGQIQFDPTVSSIAGRTLGLLQEAFIRARERGDVQHLIEKAPHTIRLKKAIDAEISRGSKSAKAFQDLASKTLLWNCEEELRHQWSTHSGFYHGDVRWDNFLLAAGRGPLGSYNLRIIDWEFAAIGDALWDAACYLSEFPRFHSLTTVPKVNGSATLWTPSFDPSTGKEAATAFLDAYSHARAGLEENWRDRLRVQTAWATLFVAWELTNNNAKYGQQETVSAPVAELIQLATNLYEQPTTWSKWFP
ncbi:MAG: phosphotransferase [Thermoplasmatota archaeon]